MLVFIGKVGEHCLTELLTLRTNTTSRNSIVQQVEKTNRRRVLFLLRGESRLPTADVDDPYLRIAHVVSRRGQGLFAFTDCLRQSLSSEMHGRRGNSRYQLSNK